MRMIHLLVIGVLVFAAAYVYRIKMESTSRVERVLRLNAEIREQRDAIAALRAEWAKLDAPLRLQGLRHAIRSVEELAGTAAGLCKARCARSDRRDDQHHRGCRRCAAHNRVRARIGRSAMTGRALTNIKRPAEPWRQRLIRSLLYGRNVDRAAKARARVGLAILLFAAIYAVLAGRLVMFAVGADSHGARRAASQDAIATARPDIVDRNGEVLATDVKAPSLFGEIDGGRQRLRDI